MWVGLTVLPKNANLRTWPLAREILVCYYNTSKDMEILHKLLNNILVVLLEIISYTVIKHFLKEIDTMIVIIYIYNTRLCFISEVYKIVLVHHLMRSHNNVEL